MLYYITACGVQGTFCFTVVLPWIQKCWCCRQSSMGIRCGTTWRWLESIFEWTWNIWSVQSWKCEWTSGKYVFDYNVLHPLILMVKPDPNYDSKEMNIIVNHQMASVT